MRIRRPLSVLLLTQQFRQRQLISLTGLFVLFLLLIVVSSTPVLVAQGNTPPLPVPAGESDLASRGTAISRDSSLPLQSRAPFTDCNAVTGITVSNCLALVALYNSAGGVNWNTQTDWLLTDIPCAWYGVTCTGGVVSELTLVDNNLIGTLPTELGVLTSMQKLDLSANQLTGSIPTSFGGLTGLLNLDLGGNQLTGSIPTELGNLPAVQSISLSNNQLSGSIPASLNNLTTLQNLNLGTNQLTGTIPSLVNLDNLTTLTLSINQLSGSIPASIGSLSALTDLDIYGNAFTGSLPPELGNLSNLQHMLIGGAALTGSLPPELANITGLLEIYLRDTQISGAIPPQYGNITTLTQLDISNNQLTGAIPPELGNLQNLYRLDLSDNQLTGSIPPELTTISALQFMYLNDNQLTGGIPTGIGNQTALQEIHLENNQLTGSIPASLGNIAGLTGLNLRKNDLTGSIPPELGGTALSVVFLDHNRLSGAIPPELGNLASFPIYNLDLSSNQFEGDYPPAMNTLPVVNLDIGYNMLTASDPTTQAYLDGKQPGWNLSQTVTPTDLTANFDAGTSLLTLAWTPIPFTDYVGYYTVGCGTNSGGPYDQYLQFTADKLSGEVSFAGLPVATYFCAIDATTLANPNNISDLTSPLSAPVTVIVTTQGVPANDVVNQPALVDNQPYQYYLANFNQATGDGGSTPQVPAACSASLNLNQVKSVYYKIPKIGGGRGGPGYYPRGFGVVRAGGPGHYSRQPQSFMPRVVEIDTILAIYRIEVNNSLTLLACNDDDQSYDDGSSVVTFNRSEDEAYLVVVWNKNSASEMILQAVITEGVINGSFDLDVNGDKLPDNWKVKNPGVVRVKCKPELVYSEPCALQIKGNGLKTQLKQAITDVSSYNASDTLQLSAYLSRKNVLEGGLIRLKVTYSDASREKTTFSIPAGTSVGYESVVTSPLTLSQSVTKFVVQISYAGASGRLRLDDVTLIKSASTRQAGLLPLP